MEGGYPFDSEDINYDLSVLLISIKNWMGPYQRTPFGKYQ